MKQDTETTTAIEGSTDEKSGVDKKIVIAAVASIVAVVGALAFARRSRTTVEETVTEEIAADPAA